jgi:hypothetical protein
MPSACVRRVHVQNPCIQGQGNHMPSNQRKLHAFGKRKSYPLPRGSARLSGFPVFPWCSLSFPWRSPLAIRRTRMHGFCTLLDGFSLSFARFKAERVLAAF